MELNAAMSGERASWRLTVRRMLIGLVVGAVAFWVPTVLWKLLRANSFSGRDVVGLTIVLPLVMFATARTMQHRVPQGRAPYFMPVAACIGLWLFGPIATTLSASAFGGGFAVQPFDWGFLLLATAIFPAATFAMATYDGSLGAVVIATLVLILVAAAGAPRPRRVRKLG
jgi:hypothetical protein